MSMTVAGIEVFSALEDTSIIEACRTLSITGVCSVCGFATRGVHAPGVCHGFYCAEHCPVCTGAIEISTAEREAMVANRLRPLSKEEKQAYWTSLQWNDPVQRQSKSNAMRVARAIRAEQRAWLLQRTLHVMADFEGEGLIHAVIRDGDGCLVANILEAVQRLPASQNIAAETINQGVEAGTLRLT